VSDNSGEALFTTRHGSSSSTASQCFFRERRTQVFTPRSRFSLCRRGDHHRRNGYCRCSHGAALAMAERVCRARHWLDPTRVPGPRNRVQRCGASQSGRRAISRLARTRRTAAGHTAVSRWHRRHPRSRRTAPPLRSHRRVAVARRRSQTLPAVIPFVQHVRLALNDCPCRLFREQRHGTARTNTQVTGLEMECPGLVPTFDNHSLPSVVVRLFRCTRPSAHRQTGVLCFAP